MTRRNLISHRRNLWLCGAAAACIAAGSTALAMGERPNKDELANNGDQMEDTAQKEGDSMQHDMSMSHDMMMAKPSVEATTAMLNHWSAAAKKTGMKMVEKYGAPDEATATRMVWINNGPWKWSILTNDPTEHLFPGPHEDVLEQAINYSAPLDKFDELASYDGSVVLNRTQGEMSARCDLEGANFLALNLANDVATGAKTIDQARKYYADAIKRFKGSNEMDVYMQGLQFDVASVSKADPDKTIIKGM